MSRYVFLFDLDSTITREEIFPAISKELGLTEKLRALSRNNIWGEIPYKQRFLQGVELFKEFPISEMCKKIGEIALNEKLAEFIRNNQDRCYIVTNILDVWLEELAAKLRMERNLFCSKALVKNDYIEEVFSIVDKNAVISQMVLPFVADGDGNNDAEMIEAAEIGIGYGGVHDIAPAVLASASHVVYQEDKLVEFLERLV